jgi:hypothetical protein
VYNVEAFESVNFEVPFAQHSFDKRFEFTSFPRQFDTEDISQFSDLDVEESDFELTAAVLGPEIRNDSV